MTQKNSKKSISLDAIATWTDQNGHAWTVGAEFKKINGRLDIAAVVIEPTHGGYPITRTVLAQLPLRDLFKKVMYDETINFAQWRQSRRQARVHQGRASSDEELRLVAVVRLAALTANIPVQRAVAEALGVSQGTAGTRIKAARAKGFIPPVGGEEST